MAGPSHSVPFAGELPYQASVTIHLRSGGEHTTLITSRCRCAWQQAGALAEVVTYNGNACTVQVWRGDSTDTPKTTRYYPADEDALPF